jgi:hypothetical protein
VFRFSVSGFKSPVSSFRFLSIWFTQPPRKPRLKNIIPMVFNY